MTGASGFVGSRLGPELAAAGHEVLAMTRNPDRYQGTGRPVRGDVYDADSVAAALQGCDAAYYLVHSLGDVDFEQRDAMAARTFASISWSLNDLDSRNGNAMFSYTVRCG